MTKIHVHVYLPEPAIEKTAFPESAVTASMAETAKLLNLDTLYWCAMHGYPTADPHCYPPPNYAGCPYHPPMEPIRRWFAGIDQKPPSKEERKLP